MAELTETLLLSIRDGRKALGGNAALRLPRLDIAPGARVLVIGDNGAGKSTLLRAVAGLLELDSGNVQKGAGWSLLRMAYLPQVGGVWRDLTLAENIDMFQVVGGRGLTQGVLLDLAAHLGLASHIDRKVGTLSGGMQRLAGFLCRLCTAADALVLDEPSSGLDDARRVLIYDALASARERYQFVLATEHQFAAGARQHEDYYTEKVQVFRADLEETVQ
jgi:ABC-type multidrug transport system ATPase subunit